MKVDLKLTSVVVPHQRICFSSLCSGIASRDRRSQGSEIPGLSQSQGRGAGKWLRWSPGCWRRGFCGLERWYYCGRRVWRQSWSRRLRNGRVRNNLEVAGKGSREPSFKRTDACQRRLLGSIAFLCLKMLEQLASPAQWAGCPWEATARILHTAVQFLEQISSIIQDVCWFIIRHEFKALEVKRVIRELPRLFPTSIFNNGKSRIYTLSPSQATNFASQPPTILSHILRRASSPFFFMPVYMLRLLVPFLFFCAGNYSPY